MPACPIGIILCPGPLSIALQHWLFLDVVGEGANGDIWDPKKTGRGNLRYFHTVQITLATSGQDATGPSPDRARPPARFNDLQLACNKEELPTSGAKLSIDRKAVVIYHGTPSSGVAKGFDVRTFRQEDSFSNHHCSSLY